MVLLLTAHNVLAQKPQGKLPKKAPLAAQPPEVEEEIRQAMALINLSRVAAGLDTVSLSATLSAWCDKHAQYLVLNSNSDKIAGLKAHEEYKELPGYSQDGARAGMSSDICQGAGPLYSARAFIASLYHRIPLLQPELKSIGIGLRGYGTMNEVTVLDCLSGTEGGASIPVVCYPGPGQTDIPCEMSREMPDPTNSVNTAGYPVTVTFTQRQKIDSATIKLTDKFGRVIPCYLSSPAQPATYFSQWNTVCAIPIAPLSAGSEYHVEINCLVNGSPFSKHYTFTTKAGTGNTVSQIADQTPLSTFSMSWNEERYVDCNTAQHVGYMTDKEKLVVWILNMARLNPQLFAESVLKAYPRVTNQDKMNQSAFYQSLIVSMKTLPAQGVLLPDSLCTESALCHAVATGTTGYEGHNRITKDCIKKKHLRGECCDYGNEEPLSIVVDLLIDEDEPSLGHRTLCLSSLFGKIGVAIQPHKSYKHTAVLDFY